MLQLHRYMLKREKNKTATLELSQYTGNSTYNMLVHFSMQITLKLVKEA